MEPCETPHPPWAAELDPPGPDILGSPSLATCLSLPLQPCWLLPHCLLCKLRVLVALDALLCPGSCSSAPFSSVPYPARVSEAGPCAPQRLPWCESLTDCGHCCQLDFPQPRGTKPGRDACVAVFTPCGFSHLLCREESLLQSDQEEAEVVGLWPASPRQLLSLSGNVSRSPPGPFRCCSALHSSLCPQPPAPPCTAENTGGVRKGSSLLTLADVAVL